MGGLIRVFRKLSREEEKEPIAEEYLSDKSFVYQSLLTVGSSYHEINSMIKNNSDNIRLGPALVYDGEYSLAPQDIHGVFRIGIYKLEDASNLVQPFTGWNGEKITLDKALEISEKYQRALIHRQREEFLKRS